MTDPKPLRQTDEEHLEHIRGMECLVCTSPAEPHHLDSRGAGGSDYSAVPLCRVHHSELHSTTQRAFEDKYNVRLYEEALRILRHRIDDRNIYR